MKQPVLPLHELAAVPVSRVILRESRLFDIEIHRDALSELDRWGASAGDVIEFDSDLAPVAPDHVVFVLDDPVRKGAVLTARIEGPNGEEGRVCSKRLVQGHNFTIQRGKSQGDFTVHRNITVEGADIVKLNFAHGGQLLKLRLAEGDPVAVKEKPCGISDFELVEAHTEDLDRCPNCRTGLKGPRTKDFNAQDLCKVGTQYALVRPKERPSRGFCFVSERDLPPGGATLRLAVRADDRPPPPELRAPGPHAQPQSQGRRGNGVSRSRSRRGARRGTPHRDGARRERRADGRASLQPPGQHADGRRRRRSRSRSRSRHRSRSRRHGGVWTGDNASDAGRPQRHGGVWTSDNASDASRSRRHGGVWTTDDANDAPSSKDFRAVPPPSFLDNESTGAAASPRQRGAPAPKFGSFKLRLGEKGGDAALPQWGGDGDVDPAPADDDAMHAPQAPCDVGNAEEWEELEDEGGERYYHHLPSGHTQWECPRALISPTEVHKSSIGASQGRGRHWDDSGAPAHQDAGANGKDPLLASDRDSDNDWERVEDEHGHTYYHHLPSGRTQWEAPKTLERSPRGHADQCFTGDEWEQCWDDDGSTYYHHVPTGKTQWDPPDGFGSSCSHDTPEQNHTSLDRLQRKAAALGIRV